MRTQLHESFMVHRVPPVQLLWPSMVATAAFALIQLVTWVYGILLASPDISSLTRKSCPLLV